MPGLNPIRRKLPLIFLGILFLSLQAPADLPGAEEKKLTEEDAALRRAVSFYRAKDYPNALDEFKKAEARVPSDFLIKRYIAYLYYLMHDWDQAILKLNEALVLKSDEQLLRGLLAEIYFKRAEFEKAAEQYQLILGQSPEENMKNKAQKRLEEISELKKLFAASPEGQINVAAFMNSQPARDFSKGKFEEALTGFDDLAKKYPEDFLIHRFRGMALTQLGRTEEAVKAFQEILRKNPDHVATHFHLGQAYLAKRDTENARKEYQWVIAHDETDYRTRAEYALFRAFGVQRGRARKPWSFKLSAGYDFDTNSILKSNDPHYTVAGDKNSSRYPITWIGTFRFLQKPKWILTADTLYTHTIYHDFPHLNVYTAGPGVSALYQFSLYHKPAFLNFREGATITLLKNRFYVWSNTVSANFIANLTSRSRTTLSYRWSVNEFDSNGTDPDRTSRDGFVSYAALSNHFYFNAEKNHFVLAGYDFERQDTSGVNNIRNAHGGQLGYHFPFLEKIEGEIHFRFRDLNYKQFASTPPKRRDDIFTLTVTVSRPLTSYLDLEGSYVLEDARGKNNAYEYTRQIFSVKATAHY